MKIIMDNNIRFLIKDNNLFDYNNINNDIINIFINNLSINSETISKFDKYVETYDITKGFYKLDIGQNQLNIESTITLNPLSMSLIPLTELKHDFDKLFSKKLILASDRKKLLLKKVPTKNTDKINKNSNC